MYWVTVMAHDDRGTELTQTFSQTVHLPLTAADGRRVSGSLALGAGRLWVVNQDNDTVSVFDAVQQRRSWPKSPSATAPRARGDCRRMATPG